MSTNSKNRNAKGEEEDSLTQDTSLPTTGGQETSVVDKEVEGGASKEPEVVPKDEIALKESQEAVAEDTPEPKKAVSDEAVKEEVAEPIQVPKDEVALKKAHDTEKAEESTPEVTPEPKETVKDTEETDEILEAGTDSKVTFDPEEPQVLTPEATQSSTKATSAEKPAEEVIKGGSQHTEDEVKTKSQANVVALEAIKLDSKPTTEEAREMTMPDSTTFDKANKANSSVPDSKPLPSQTKEAPEESKPATESKPRDAEEVNFDELGMTEQEALAYLKEEEEAKKAAAGSGPPKIQVYGSSVSGNFKIKKAQNKILDTLERFGIEYEFMDLAADDEAKLYIKRKNPNSAAIPQIYINGEFAMEFAEFEELLEYDELFDALGVEPDF